MYFDETQLNDHVLDALYDMRFDVCTPIQEQCIPPILEGRDLLGVAQTGTGKTAAYLLPILSRLDDGGFPKDAINCVIMSPTRELAQQIDQAMQGFGYYLDGVSSVAVYGGNDGNRYDQELKSFQMGADVVIATPGRLISHISLGSADLSRVSFFVLDEADRMLDMGFSEDIKMIASKLPPTCQTIMFSATMPEKIEELAKTLLKNPVEVKIAVSKPAEKIKQTAYVCYETQKIGIIKDLFRKGDLNRVIIFSGKKQKVKAINRTLQQMKINSGEMHSDLEQAERDEILYKFKTGQIDVLVATDIVARGIDIDDIAMVINFDVPHDPEDYVHRIGRTARAERDGVAITFVSDGKYTVSSRLRSFSTVRLKRWHCLKDWAKHPTITLREAKASPTATAVVVDEARNRQLTSRLLKARRSLATSATASLASDLRTAKQLANRATLTSRRQTKNRSLAARESRMAGESPMARGNRMARESQTTVSVRTPSRSRTVS